jgi:hypothetical protein
VLWWVVSTYPVLGGWATCRWILVIGRLTQATLLSDFTVSSHADYAVLHLVLMFFDSQWTQFDNWVSAYSIQEAFAAKWRSLSGFSKLRHWRTFLNIFAKPDLMADALLILALLSFSSLWLIPMSMVSSHKIADCVHKLPKTWCALLHWAWSWMHPKQAARCAPSIICGFWMHSTPFCMPPVLIEICESICNLRKH